MEKKVMLNKTISLLLTLFLAFPQGIQAQGSSPAQTQASPQLLSSHDLIIPQEIGTIMEVHQAPAVFGSSRPLIIHVLDAHANYDAQNSIKNLLDFLRREYSVNLVGVEGAASRLNPEIFKFFPDAEKNMAIAERLAKKGELSGPELYALTAPAGTEMHGIENEEAYKENLRLFQELLEKKSAFQEQFAFIDNAFKVLKKKYYSSELLHFDDYFEQYRSEKQDLYHWTRKLIPQAEKYLGVDLQSPLAQESYPFASRLAFLVGTEKEMRYDLIEREAKDLAAALAGQSASADKTVLLELASILQSGFRGKTKNYQSYRLFFAYLFDLCRRQNIELEGKIHFRRWSAMQIEQEEIEAGELFEELDRIANSIFNKLSKTAEQKELVRFDRMWHLSKKLLRGEISKDDFLELTIVSAENSQPALRQVIDGIRGFYTAASLQIPDSIADTAGLDELTRLGIDFYRGTETRDLAMLEKIESLMNDQAAERMAIVTGGFHRKGLGELLRKQGYSYLVVAPRVLAVDPSDRANYEMEILNSRKTVFDTIKGVQKALAASGFQISGGNLAHRDQVVLEEALVQVVMELAAQLRANGGDDPEKMAAAFNAIAGVVNASPAAQEFGISMTADNSGITLTANAFAGSDYVVGWDAVSGISQSSAEVNAGTVSLALQRNVRPRALPYLSAAALGSLVDDLKQIGYWPEGLADENVEQVLWGTDSGKSPFRAVIEKRLGIPSYFDLVSFQRLPKENEEYAQQLAGQALIRFAAAFAQAGYSKEQIESDDFQSVFAREFGNRPLLVIAGNATRFAKYQHKGTAVMGIGDSNLRLAKQGAYTTPGVRPTIVMSAKVFRFAAKEKYAAQAEELIAGLLDGKGVKNKGRPGEKGRLYTLTQEEIDEYFDREKLSEFLAGNVNIAFARTLGHGDVIGLAAQELAAREDLGDARYIQMAFGEMAEAALLTKSNASFITYLSNIASGGRMASGGKIAEKYDGEFTPKSIEAKGNFFMQKGNLRAYTDWEQIPNNRPGKPEEGKWGNHPNANFKALADRLTELQSKLDILRAGLTPYHRLPDMKRSELDALIAEYPAFLISEDGYVFSQEALLSLLNTLNDWANLDAEQRAVIRETFGVDEKGNILISSNTGVWEVSLINEMADQTSELFDAYQNSVQGNDKLTAVPNDFISSDPKDGFSLKTLAWNFIRRANEEIGNVNGSLALTGKAPSSTKDVTHHFKVGDTRFDEIRSALRAKGVNVDNLTGLSFYLGGNAEISIGEIVAKVEKGAVLSGHVYFDGLVRVRTMGEISNSSVGDQCTVAESAVINDTVLGDGVTVGEHAKISAAVIPAGETIDSGEILTGISEASVQWAAAAAARSADELSNEIAQDLTAGDPAASRAIVNILALLQNKPELVYETAKRLVTRNEFDLYHHLLSGLLYYSQYLPAQAEVIKLISHLHAADEVHRAGIEPQNWPAPSRLHWEVLLIAMDRQILNDHAYAQDGLWEFLLQFSADNGRGANTPAKSQASRTGMREFVFAEMRRLLLQETTQEKTLLRIAQSPELLDRLTGELRNNFDIKNKTLYEDTLLVELTSAMLANPHAQVSGLIKKVLLAAAFPDTPADVFDSPAKLAANIVARRLEVLDKTDSFSPIVAWERILDVSRFFPSDAREKIKIIFDRHQHAQRSHSMAFPAEDLLLPDLVTAARSAIARYLATYINNGVHVYGASAAYVQGGSDEFYELVREKFTTHFDAPEGQNPNAESVTDYAGSIYGTQLDSLVQRGTPPPAPQPLPLAPVPFDKNKNTVIGVDVGGTQVKITILRDGVPIYENRANNTHYNVSGNQGSGVSPDWTSENLLQQIRHMVNEGLSHAQLSIDDINAVGVAWAGAVADNQVAGSSTALFDLQDYFSDRDAGVKNEAVVERMRNLGRTVADAIAPEKNLTSVLINDGDAFAYKVATEQGLINALVLALGTGLAGGYVDAEGSIGKELNELGRVVLDMSLKSPAHQYTGVKGLGREYVSGQTGIREGKKVGLGYVAMDKLAPADRPESADKLQGPHIEKLFALGDEKAEKVFLTLARNIAMALIHVDQFLDSKNAVLAGGALSGQFSGPLILREVTDLLRPAAEQIDGTPSLVSVFRSAPRHISKASDGPYDGAEGAAHFANFQLQKNAVPSEQGSSLGVSGGDLQPITVEDLETLAAGGQAAKNKELEIINNLKQEPRETFLTLLAFYTGKPGDIKQAEKGVKGFVYHETSEQAKIAIKAFMNKLADGARFVYGKEKPWGDDAGDHYIAVIQAIRFIGYTGGAEAVPFLKRIFNAYRPQLTPAGEIDSNKQVRPELYEKFGWRFQIQIINSLDIIFRSSRVSDTEREQIIDSFIEVVKDVDVPKSWLTWNAAHVEQPAAQISMRGYYWVRAAAMHLMASPIPVGRGSPLEYRNRRLTADGNDEEDSWAYSYAVQKVIHPDGQVSYEMRRHVRDALRFIARLTLPENAAHSLTNLNVGHSASDVHDLRYSANYALYEIRKQRAIIQLRKDYGVAQYAAGNLKSDKEYLLTRRDDNGEEFFTLLMEGFARIRNDPREAERSDASVFELATIEVYYDSNPDASDSVEQRNFSRRTALLNYAANLPVMKPGNMTPEQIGQLQDEFWDLMKNNPEQGLAELKRRIYGDGEEDRGFYVEENGRSRDYDRFAFSGDFSLATWKQPQVDAVIYLMQEYKVLLAANHNDAEHPDVKPAGDILFGILRGLGAFLRSPSYSIDEKLSFAKLLDDEQMNVFLRSTPKMKEPYMENVLRPLIALIEEKHFPAMNAAVSSFITDPEHKRFNDADSVWQGIITNYQKQKEVLFSRGTPGAAAQVLAALQMMQRGFYRSTLMIARVLTDSSLDISQYDTSPAASVMSGGGGTKFLLPVTLKFIRRILTKEEAYFKQVFSEEQLKRIHKIMDLAYFLSVHDDGGSTRLIKTAFLKAWGVKMIAPGDFMNAVSGFIAPWRNKALDARLPGIDAATGKNPLVDIVGQDEAGKDIEKNKTLRQIMEDGYTDKGKAIRPLYEAETAFFQHRLVEYLDDNSRWAEADPQLKQQIEEKIPALLLTVQKDGKLKGKSPDNLSRREKLELYTSSLNEDQIRELKGMISDEFMNYKEFQKYKDEILRIVDVLDEQVFRAGVMRINGNSIRNLIFIGFLIANGGYAPHVVNQQGIAQAIHDFMRVFDISALPVPIEEISNVLYAETMYGGLKFEQDFISHTTNIPGEDYYANGLQYPDVFPEAALPDADLLQKAPVVTAFATSAVTSFGPLISRDDLMQKLSQNTGLRILVLPPVKDEESEAIPDFVTYIKKLNSLLPDKSKTLGHYFDAVVIMDWNSVLANEQRLAQIVGESEDGKRVIADAPLDLRAELEGVLRKMASDKDSGNYGLLNYDAQALRNFLIEEMGFAPQKIIEADMMGVVKAKPHPRGKTALDGSPLQVYELHYNPDASVDALVKIFNVLVSDEQESVLRGLEQSFHRTLETDNLMRELSGGAALGAQAESETWDPADSEVTQTSFSEAEASVSETAVAAEIPLFADTEQQLRNLYPELPVLHDVNNYIDYVLLFRGGYFDEELSAPALAQLLASDYFQNHRLAVSFTGVKTGLSKLKAVSEATLQKVTQSPERLKALLTLFGGEAFFSNLVMRSEADSTSPFSFANPNTMRAIQGLLEVINPKAHLTVLYPGDEAAAVAARARYLEEVGSSADAADRIQVLPFNPAAQEVSGQFAGVLTQAFNWTVSARREAGINRESDFFRSTTVIGSDEFMAQIESSRVNRLNSMAADQELADIVGADAEGGAETLQAVGDFNLVFANQLNRIQGEAVKLEREVDDVVRQRAGIWSIDPNSFVLEVIAEIMNDWGTAAELAQAA